MILINRNVEFNRVYMSMVAEPGNWDKHMYRRGKSMGSQGRTFNPRTKRSRKRESYRFPKWWIHQYGFWYWDSELSFLHLFGVAIYAIYFYVFLQWSLPNVTKHPEISCDRGSWRSTSKRWRRQYPMDTPAVAPPQPNPWGGMARYGYCMLLSLLGAKQGHPKDSNVWLKMYK
jgi:hypothetical protein